MAYQFLYNAAPPFSLRIKVLAAHGWDCGPQGGLPFIKASNLSSREQLSEYLDVEIEIWKQFAAEQEDASV